MKQVSQIKLFSLLVGLVWLLAGCGGQQPTSVVVVGTPSIGEPKVGAPSPQQPGEEIGISIEIASTGGVTLNYAWTADGGEIVRGQGSPAITYRVPEEAGTYNVRVKIEWDGQSIEKVTSIKVEGVSTEPTPEPPTDTPEPAADTPTPKPTSTPKPTNTPKPPTDTPTPTPTPTNTLAPTNTLQPTPAPTSTKAEPSSLQITSERGKLIQNRGTIFIGILENDLYPMAFRQNNDYQGFEIDLAREIVQRRFGNNVTIEWVPLSLAERFEAIRTDRADFLIRNTTHTVSRENLVAFTSNYFWDGIRLLVRRGGGYTGIESMNGKTIVVIDYTTTSNTTAESVVRQAATAAGVEVNVIVDNNAPTVFMEGRADAVAMDWVAHSWYSNDYNAHQAIGGLLSSEPIAIAVSKDDPVFRDEIDTTLLEIIWDGTWQTIYNRWFPDPPPWTIEEMLNAPPPG